MLILFFMLALPVRAESPELRLLRHRLLKRLHHTHLIQPRSNLTEREQDTLSEQQLASVNQCLKKTQEKGLNALRLLEILDELEMEAALTEKAVTSTPGPFLLKNPSIWARILERQQGCKTRLIEVLRKKHL
jgi:hypothetical protein